MSSAAKIVSKAWCETKGPQHCHDYSAAPSLPATGIPWTCALRSIEWAGAGGQKADARPGPSYLIPRRVVEASLSEGHRVGNVYDAQAALIGDVG